MMPPTIDPARCTLCGVCQDVCPGDILHINRGINGLVRYPDECQHCDICRLECPETAIQIIFPVWMRQHPHTTAALGGTDA
jgi:adenylylsulfate reductase subunit B